MLKREVDCEDAIQNTLLRAYANLKTLRKHLVPYEEKEDDRTKSLEWGNEYSEVYEALMTLKETYRPLFAFL